MFGIVSVRYMCLQLEEAAEKEEMALREAQENLRLVALEGESKSLSFVR